MPGLMRVAGGNTIQSWQGYCGNYDGLLTSWTGFDFGYRKAEMNTLKAAAVAVLADPKNDKMLAQVTVCLDPDDYAKFEILDEEERHSPAWFIGPTLRDVLDENV